ncbi:MAG: mgpS, partial [Labilithrix sp.]|nr:mgpS [Labilithrix sp.]
VVYLPRGVLPIAVDARLALTTAWYRTGRALIPPSGGAVSFVPGRGIERRAYTAIGFPVVGPRAIRADVLDRVLDHVHTAKEDEPLDDAKLATWIGAPKSELRKVLASLHRPVEHEHEDER